MKASLVCLALVKGFERFSATPYLCPAGWWTIGYGAVRDAAGAPVTAATPAISEPEALAILGRDVGIAERAVLRLIRRAELTQGRFDALVSFTFNLGAGRLQASTLRRVVNRGEHARAPCELVRWVYGGGRKLPGLVRRRKAEAILYGAS
jgi:lysozyme